MKTYARIDNGVVVELLATDGDIHAMFHRDLRWIEVAGVAGIGLGWRHDATGFAPAPSTVAEHVASPSGSAMPGPAAGVGARAE